MKRLLFYSVFYLICVCVSMTQISNLNTWNTDLNQIPSNSNIPKLGFSDPFPIYFYTDSVFRAVLSGSDGYWGINTSKPKELFHLYHGNILVEGTSNYSPNIFWTDDVQTNSQYYMQYGLEYLSPSSKDVGGLNFWKPWQSNNGMGANGYKNYILYLRNDGRVTVGGECVPSDALLGVNGKLYAREIEVNLQTWCDSIFEPGYPLMSLDSLRRFIHVNKHLPGIPSQNQVLLESKMNLMEMNLMLLQKVEELHLYILLLESKIQRLPNQFGTKME